MPRDVTEKEVRKTFEDYLKKNGTSSDKRRVYRVNFAYYIGDFIEIAREKNEHLKILFKEKRQPWKDEILIQEEETKIKLLDKQLNQLNQKYKEIKSSKNALFTGICLITFNSMKDRDFIYEAWKINFLAKASLKYMKCLQRCYNTQNERFRGKAVVVRDPPEPGDILWENLGTPFGILLKTRLITFILVIAILVASFFAILGLKYAQLKTVGTSSNSFVRIVLGLVIAVTLIIVNAILGISIRKISSYEKYITLTEFNSSVAKRIAFVSLYFICKFLNFQATWLNTCLIIVAVNYLIHGRDMKNEMWSNKGLASDAFLIMITNIFTAPLLAVINPVHFYRYWVRRKIKNKSYDQTKEIYTQAEANFWFEGPPLDIAQEYANYAKTVMVSLFFMFIIPLSPVLGALAILTAHWVNKYLLLYRYTSPKATGVKINFDMYQFFDLTLIIYGVSIIILISNFYKLLACYGDI